MPINKPMDLEEIRKTINVSSSKNNNLLIFFTVFMLYILISVLGTSDLMLLLPENTFKMPIINFELDLIAFYILAPIMLLLLHFNNLFNYNMYLKKIDKHSKQINMETLDPSIYGYAYSLANHGLGGFLINLFLWIWIYLIPIFVLIFISIRFADYHVEWISNIHIIIVLLDIALIFLSFHYNKIHIKNTHRSIRILSVVFRCFIFCIGIAGLLYYFIFFRPVIDEPLDTRIQIQAENHHCMGWVYNILTEGKDNNISTECFPRLVVNEAEMAKITSSALYIPRYLALKQDMNKNDKERQLILDYGTRSNLKGRNLRYADLYGCILTRANLQNSDLRNSDLRNSHLQAADLTNAKLQNANLTEAKLEQTILKDANLSHALLARVITDSEPVYYENTVLTDAQLVNSKMDKVDFWKAHLTGANFLHANLSESNFYEADLTGANFRDSNLTKTVFTNAVLIAVDFTKAYGQDHSTSLKSILNNAKETGAIVIQSDLNNTDSKIYLTDLNLTSDEKCMILDNKIETNPFHHNVRRVIYLDDGIKKYSDPQGECNNEPLSDKLKTLIIKFCRKIDKTMIGYNKGKSVCREYKMKEI